MQAQPLDARVLPSDSPSAAVPKIPAVVVSAHKGGVWKTSIAVSLAERLAFAGLRVGLLATDAQQDARARLGIRPAESDIVRVPRGSGVVAAIGLAGPAAADILYRRPERIGPADAAVVDTAPTPRGMRLPGTLVVVPVADEDSTRNNVAALLGLPENCRIVLVRTGSRMVPADWRAEVERIVQAVGRRGFRYLPTPLPPSDAIARAHAEGRSVWSLARRGAVKSFLEGIEAVASIAWRHVGRSGDPPPAPPSGSVETFIPGWDDDDDK